MTRMMTLLAALGNVSTDTSPIQVIEPVSIIPNAELDATLAHGDKIAGTTEGANA